MTIDVRPAELSDARGIAEVHVQAWREAYSHLVPPDALARLNVDQRELRWVEIIDDDVTDVLVALDGDVIIGWATASSGRDEDAPRDRELEAIYVIASMYGSGAGQSLLEAVVSNSPAYLWVADDNPRARAFYARNGFVPDGTTKVGPLAGTDVLEIRLVR